VTRRVAGGTVRIAVVDQTRSINTAILCRRLRQAARLVRTSLRELSVALVGTATMSRLHRQYLGVSGPTDVLTFAIDMGAGGGAVSGEVVLCVSVARRQAATAGVSLNDELLLYALHGLLHLCGYDDRDGGGYRRMHRAEDRILKKIGVGRIFDAGPTRARGRKRKQRRTLA
jgi:probable rRNA maturation factor